MAVSWEGEKVKFCSVGRTLQMWSSVGGVGLAVQRDAMDGVVFHGKGVAVAGRMGASRSTGSRLLSGAGQLGMVGQGGCCRKERDGRRRSSFILSAACTAGQGPAAVPAKSYL